MKRILQLGSTFAAAIVLTFTSCKKEENAPLPQSTDESTAERTGPTGITAIFQPGYVYTQSNSRENAVLVYAQLRDGSLQYRSTAKTGGRGTGLPLGSQGSVTVDPSHLWLYAVNAADNTVSAFRIGRDGNLNLAGMVSSGGVMPVSVTAFKNFVYVVNAGSDNIQGFITGADISTAYNARMIPIRGSSLKLSQSNAGAAQISFSPNGAYLYVTEKNTDLISSYYVDINGITHTGYTSQSLGKTPFGFAFARDVMVVSNAFNGEAGVGAATSFVGANTGSLMPTANPVFNGQTSSCWTAVTPTGGFAYITNTGSNTISAYQVGLYGRLKLLYADIAGGMSPIDIVIDGNATHVYVLSSGDHTIRQYVRTADGFLTSMIPVDGVRGIPETAAGLAILTPGTTDSTK
jgi:6-phosphogluconolactonase